MKIRGKLEGAIPEKATGSYPERLLVPPSIAQSRVTAVRKAAARKASVLTSV